MRTPRGIMTFMVDLGKPLTWYRFIETLSNSPYPELQVIANEILKATPEEYSQRSIEANRHAQRTRTDT